MSLSISHSLRGARRAAVALVALALVAGCGSEESSLKYLESARQHYEKGERVAAVIELKNALEKNPANGEARLLLGTVYNETGFYADAEKELRRAQQLRVKPGETAAALGRSLVGQRQYQKALDEVAPLPASEGVSAAAVLASRGDAYLGLGKLPEAREAFEGALRIAADHPDALVGLARLRLLDRDVAGAGALVDRAVAQPRPSVDAWLLKADLLRFDGHYERAIAAFGEAIKVAPFNFSARMSRAALYLNQGKTAEAQREVDAMKKLAKDRPVVHYTQALIHYRNREYAKAQESLQFVLRSAPDFAPARLLLGAVNFDLGALGQADQILSRFVEDFPSSAEARKMLTTVLIRTGQAKRALETAAPLEEARPNDPTVLGLIGEAYLLLGDHAKASRYLERGIAVDPQSAALQTVFGIAQLQSGQLDRAVDAFASASQSDTEKSVADYLRVTALIRERRYDDALKALEPLQKKRADSPVPLELMAVAYQGKGDLAGARRSLEQALKINPRYVPAAVRLGEIDVAENRLEQARKRLEDMLAKAPKDVRLMAALAQVAGRAKDRQGMLDWLEKARAADPKAVEPRLILAKAYVAGGKPDKAVPVLREALKAEPTRIEALDLLGHSLRLQGEDREALETYRQLVRVAPRSPVAHLRLAALQALTEDRAGAEASLRRALELKPDFEDAKVNLALMMASAGKPDEAIRLARELQKQNPRSGAGFALEGDILMSQRKAKEAVAAYVAATAREQTSALALRLYLAQVQAGDKTAVERLQQWTEKHPGDVQARLFVADAHAKAGRTDAAEKQYEAVLRVDPKNVMALNNLANSLQERKDPRALPLAEKAYGVAPRNPAVADTYGWMLVESGQLDKGIPVLKKALEDHPDAPELRYHLAAALARSGDRANARKELEALLQSGKRFQQAEQARALLSQLSR